MVHNPYSQQSVFLALILEFEREGLVTRTFRRLDPERQMAVVQAILDEAADKGPAEVNIKKIAERAGVSIGSLYQYFGSRDGLLAFTTQLVVRTTTDLFSEGIDYLVKMPFYEALNAYLSYGIQWGEEQVGFTRFFGAAAYQGNSELTEQVVQPIAKVMLTMVRATLAAAIERGELRADLDVEATARLLHTILIAVGDAQLIHSLNAYYQLFDEEMTPARLQQAFYSLLQKGLNPRGEQ